MQFMPILSLREGALIAGAVVAVILFLWFLARLSHRPYFVISQLQADQMTVIQLSKIADSIDRLARSLENKTHSEEVGADAPTRDDHGRIGLSMFGR